MTKRPSFQRKLGSSGLQSVKDTGLTSFAVVERLSLRWNDESAGLHLQKKNRIRARVETSFSDPHFPGQQ
jgi:hypothetical protein